VQASSKSTFINAQLYSTCDYQERQKCEANLIKPMQTGIKGIDQTMQKEVG
jgi:hypothetical protein